MGFPGKFPAENPKPPETLIRCRKNPETRVPGNPAGKCGILLNLCIFYEHWEVSRKVSRVFPLFFLGFAGKFSGNLLRFPGIGALGV